MKKRFCDFCGMDIINECIFQLGIYDEILEKNSYEKDLCEFCKKSVIAKIKSMEKD